MVVGDMMDANQHVLADEDKQLLLSLSKEEALVNHMLSAQLSCPEGHCTKIFAPSCLVHRPEGHCTKIFAPSRMSFQLLASNHLTNEA
jgi:hypothetical protein